MQPPAFSVIIPTDGTSEYLLPLIQNALPDAEAVIVVWTAPSEPALPDGVTVIRDSTPMAIHVWWNRGIAASPTDVVVVCNDDLEAPPHSLAGLAASLVPTGATLAMIANHRLTGWCYALDRSHGVLPDERFNWFYGDDYLLHEASTRGRGAVRHPAPEIIHRRFRNGGPEMRAQLRADRALYWALRSRPSQPAEPRRVPPISWAR